MGLVLIALSSGFLPSNAFAQAIDQVVSDQTAVIQRYSAPRAPGTINIAVPELRRRVPLEKAAQVRFTLRSLTVAGAVTVPMAQLSPAWSDKIGATISVADLYRIAEGIEAAYTSAGYFSMAVVADQDFSAGHIVITLYESYVRQVVIKSDLPGLEKRLAPYIDRIVAMRPIRIKEAERVLLLMSDLAGLKIDGIFTKPQTPSAGGELMLTVTFTRSSRVAILDNTGTSRMGPMQLAGSATVNDVFGLFDSTEFVGLTIPDTPRQLLFIQETQDIPIGHDGLHVGYRLGHISSRPGDDLKPLDVKVAATFGNLYLNYPFLRTIDHSVFGRVELNFKNNEVDFGPVLRARDSDRWVAASLRYLTAYQGGSATVSATFGQGLDVIGASSGLDAFISRQGVRSDYRFLRVDADIGKEIVTDITARLRIAAQYAPDALPSAVQLNIGGDPFGLAFDTSAASGDSAMAANLEISRNFVSPVARVSDTQLFAFVDYGAIWNHNLSVAYVHETLGSAGIGVRGLVAEAVNAQLLVAVPWEDRLNLADKGTRIFVKLIAPF